TGIAIAAATECRAASPAGEAAFFAARYVRFQRQNVRRALWTGLARLCPRSQWAQLLHKRRNQTAWARRDRLVAILVYPGRGPFAHPPARPPKASILRRHPITVHSWTTHPGPRQ